MLREIDNFYEEKTEPVKTCLLALRRIILDQDSHITESKKYGMPCFSLKGEILCYLWTDKKTGDPYLLMVEGKYLHHPELEQGSRSRMKILRVDPNNDLPLETIKTILKSALSLCEKAVPKSPHTKKVG